MKAPVQHVWNGSDWFNTSDIYKNSQLLMCSLASLTNQASFKAALYLHTVYVNEQIKCAVISILRKNVGLALGKYDCFILKQSILFGFAGDGCRLHIIDQTRHSEKAQGFTFFFKWWKQMSRISSAPLTRCQTMRVCVFSLEKSTWDYWKSSLHVLAPSLLANLYLYHAISAWFLLLTFCLLRSPFQKISVARLQLTKWFKWHFPSLVQFKANSSFSHGRIKKKLCACPHNPQLFFYTGPFCHTGPNQYLRKYLSQRGHIMYVWVFPLPVVGFCACTRSAKKLKSQSPWQKTVPEMPETPHQ